MNMPSFQLVVQSVTEAVGPQETIRLITPQPVKPAPVHAAAGLHDA